MVQVTGPLADTDAPTTPALSACMTPGRELLADWTTTPAPWLPPPDVWRTPQPTRSNNSNAATPLPVTVVVPLTTELAPACDDVTPRMPAKIAAFVRRTVIFIRSHAEVPSFTPAPPTNRPSLIDASGTGHCTVIWYGDELVAEIGGTVNVGHVVTADGNGVQSSALAAGRSPMFVRNEFIAATHALRGSEVAPAVLRPDK